MTRTTEKGAPQQEQIQDEIRRNPRAALRRQGVSLVSLPPQVRTHVVTYRP